MKFSIAFDYYVSWVPKGRRTEQSAYAPARADVEIAEASGLPVFVAAGAVTARDHDHLAFPLLAGRPALVYEMDGRLYAQRVAVADFAAKTATRNHPQNLMRGTDGGIHVNTVREDAKQPSMDPEAVRRSAGEIRSWSDDGGAGVARVLRQRAEDLLVVDGVVCCRVSEPCYLVLPGVSANDGPAEVRVTVVESGVGPGPRFLVPGDMSTHVHGLRYAIDRREDAIAYAGRMAEALGLPLVDCTVVEGDPSRKPRFEADREALERAVALTLRSFVPLLAQLPEPLGIAVARLRDAFDEQAEQVRAPVVEALSGVVAALPTQPQAVAMHEWGNARRYNEARSMASSGLGGLEQVSSPELFLHVRLMAGEALARWEAGMARRDDWLDRPGGLPRLTYGNGRVEEVLSPREVSELAAGMAADLSEWKRRASEDGARILAVRMGDSTGAALVSVEGDVPVVLESVGMYGRPLSETLALRLSDYMRDVGAPEPVADVDILAMDF